MRINTPLIDQTTQKLLMWKSTKAKSNGKRYEALDAEKNL